MVFADIAVLIILVLFGIMGYVKGFVKIVGYFAAVLIGSFIAYKFYGAFSSEYIKFFENNLINEIVAALIIFIAVVVIVKVITNLLHKVASFSLISWFNRLCGVLAGLLKGALIMGIILVPLAQQKKINNYFKNNTYLVKYIVAFDSYIYSQLKAIF